MLIFVGIKFSWILLGFVFPVPGFNILEYQLVHLDIWYFNHPNTLEVILCCPFDGILGDIYVANLCDTRPIFLDEKWSSQTILGGLKMVWPDQYWQLTMVQPDQKWSGVTNSALVSSRSLFKFLTHLLLLAASYSICMNWYST